MKDFFIMLLKTPMFLVFLGITLFFGAPALASPAELDRYAVVTSIGIDKVESGYEVSLLTFIPIAEQNFAETYKVVSAVGETISQGIDYAGLYVGRKIGLSHIKTIVVSDTLLDSDLGEQLDFFSRDDDVSLSTKLIVTDVKVKDFLDAVQKLDSEASIKISELVSYNSKQIYATESSLETFYKGRFSPTEISLVPVFSLSKGNDGVSVENAGQSGTDNESEKSSQSEKGIVNNGESIVLKKGEKKLVLSREDVSNLNFLYGDFETGEISVYDFYDDVFKGANLTFEILNKNIKKSVDFDNDKIFVDFDIKLEVLLKEVSYGTQALEQNLKINTFSNELKDAIKSAVQEKIYTSFEIMKENGLDIVNFYTTAYNSNAKKFNKILEKCENSSDYLSKMVCQADVNITIR